MLTREIMSNLYDLVPEELDSLTSELQLENWESLGQLLEFQPTDTGGGCKMLLTDMPSLSGHQIGITDGEADLPSNIDKYWLGVFDSEGNEMSAWTVQTGRVI